MRARSRSRVLPSTVHEKPLSPAANARVTPNALHDANVPRVASRLVRHRLLELLQEVAPGETMDKEVEEFLQEHVDEFVDSVTEFSCRFAKHRNSRTLEARDVNLYLEKGWNIRVPGFGDDPKPVRRGAQAGPSAHAARLQAIAKLQQNNP